jgi:DNA-binding MarR family transcriptional regulator
LPKNLVDGKAPPTGKSRKPQSSEDPKRFARFGYLLNRTGALGAATMSDLLDAHNVALPVWQMLLILSDFGELTLSELASHSGFELSYVSRVVLNTQQLGLISRSELPSDRRSIRLSLTSAGHAMVRKILPKTRSLGNIMLKGIPESDIDATFRTLRAVYENLTSFSGDTSAEVNRKRLIARRTGNSSSREPTST